MRKKKIPLVKHSHRVTKLRYADPLKALRLLTKIPHMSEIDSQRLACVGGYPSSGSHFECPEPSLPRHGLYLWVPEPVRWVVRFLGLGVSGAATAKEAMKSGWRHRSSQPERQRNHHVEPCEGWDPVEREEVQRDSDAQEREWLPARRHTPWKIEVSLVDSVVSIDPTRWTLNEDI